MGSPRVINNEEKQKLIIQLILAHQKPPVIATKLHINRTTVYHWIKKINYVPPRKKIVFNRYLPKKKFEPPEVLTDYDGQVINRGHDYKDYLAKNHLRLKATMDGFVVKKIPYIKCLSSIK